MSSSKKPLSLFLTSLTPGIWAQFYHWYKVRGTDHEPDYPPSGHGVWIARQVDEPVVIMGKPLLFPDGSPQPELIAGCCCFPCDGPFAIIDFVNTNPAVPPRLRHKAIELVCWGIRNYGAMTGRKPVCHPMHKGVIRMMEKTGYFHTKPGVIPMYSLPWVPVWAEKTELTSAPATMDSADVRRNAASEGSDGRGLEADA